jgi:PPP family 3-phenylpropionic acid transporter
MSIPIFFLFTIYSIANVYLPLFLRNMGYTATLVGFLMACFEISGLIFPMILSPLIAKKGKYSLFLIIFASAMIIIPFPLYSIPGLGVAAICLSLYAIGLKGAVPVSDSLVNSILGEKRDNYGKVRVAGSIGFVSMNLLLQVFIHVDTITVNEKIFWTALPSALFLLSIIFVPGILHYKPALDSVPSEEIPLDSKETKESIITTLKKFSPLYWFGIISLFLIFLGLTPSTRFFSMYVDEYLHSDASGLLWALAALSEIPFMFFSYRFVRKYNTISLLIFCAIFATIRNLFYICIPNLFGAALGQLCNSITYGLLHPVAVLFVTEHAPDKKSLVVSMSMYSVLAVGVANFLGNGIGGYLIDTFGYPFFFVSFAILPLIPVVAYFFLKKKLRKYSK